MATTTTPRPKISAPRTGARAYDAFVSYSHAADGRLAPALQTGLQSLAKPWYRRRALRVFRDKTSLSASPELWSAIEAALSQARFFVLLASPDAAASHWVDQEVRWWREHRSHDTVLIALTDGELRWANDRRDFDEAAAVPPDLRGWFPREPLWVDLRWARAERDVSMRNPRFRDAVGELAAPMHGVPKDELIGEDISQHRRTLRLARGAVALLVLLLTGAVIGAVVALVQRDRAIEQETLAVARELAAESTNQRELDPELALLLAIEAVRRKGTPETEDALRAALAGDHLRAVLPVRRATSVEFSPDGKSILTAGGDGRARLWSLPSLDPGNTFRAGPPGSTNADFGGHGRLVLTTNATSATKIWDAATGRLVQALPDGDGHIVGGAISPNGRLIVTAGESGVLLWTSRGRRRAILQPPGGAVETLAFSPDGQRVAGGGFSRFIRVWQISKPASTRALRVDRGGINSVTFDSSGQFVLATGTVGSVWRFDLVDERREAVVEPPPGAFNPPAAVTAQMSNDGALTAVGTDDGALTVLGGDKGFSTQTTAGPVWDLDFPPDGETIATALGDGTVRLFALRAVNGERTLLRAPAATTTSVVFSPDGRFVAAPDSEGTTRVWASSGRKVRSVHYREIGLNAETRLFRRGLTGDPRASFSPDGRLLAVAEPTGTTVWPMLARHPTLRLQRPASDATFSPDGTLLAIAEHTGEVSLRRISDGGVKDMFSAGRGRPLKTIAFSPDGASLLALATDGITRIWNLEEGKVVHRLGGRGSPIADAALSPSGGDIVTVRGRRVAVTDLASGETDVTPQVSQRPFESVTYSSDGRHILAASEDGHAFVFDAAELRSFATFVSSGESLTDAAFSPNGARVALSGGGAVRVIRCDLCASSSRLVAIAEANATRDLSPSERRRYLHESD